MNISVVVLSYNRPEMLRIALASITAQTSNPTEVIVIDNPSPRSQDVARVVAEFPGVRIVANRQNLGYTGGMNLGLRMAAGEYVLLTEDDIRLDREAIRELEHHARVHPGSICGGLMLNETAGTIRCAGGNVRIETTFQLEVIGADQPDTGAFTTPISVTFLPGAFLFAHRGVWGHLGGFRDIYRLYMEDVDLSLRAVRRGIPLMVIPSVRIFHFEPRSDVDPEWLALLKYRNLLRLFLLNAPLGRLPAFLARAAIWTPVRNSLRFRREGLRQSLAVLLTVLELPKLFLGRRLS